MILCICVIFHGLFINPTLNNNPMFTIISIVVFVPVFSFFLHDIINFISELWQK